VFSSHNYCRITKTSKRASMLLSDVAGASSSFLGSLTGALAPSMPTNSATLRDSTLQQISVKYFPPMAVESTAGSNRSPSSPSILDEGNDDRLVQCIPRGPAPPGFTKLNPPLVPNKLIARPAAKASTSKTDTDLLDDDEEWNW
jgi:hypothetical protein